MSILVENIEKFLEKLKELDIEKMSDEQRANLISDGYKLARESKFVVKNLPKKRTMEDIVDEQAAKVRIGTVEVPNPLRGISYDDIDFVEGLIQSQKATSEATYKAVGTVFTLLMTAAMFVA
jgi:hypothetical protein